MSETKIKLNPCPECGGQADIEQAKYSLGGIYMAVCENFRPDKDDPACPVAAAWTKEDCINEWNSFTPLPKDEYQSEYQDAPFHSRYNAMD